MQDAGVPPLPAVTKWSGRWLNPMPKNLENRQTRNAPPDPTGITG